MTFRIEWDMALRCVVLLLAGTLLVSTTTLGQPTEPDKALQPAVRANTMAAPQAGAPMKFKGIWEPISYPDDMKWFDVFFATGDEGWVAGGATEIAGGLIIHTMDGGDHWEVQYGDPQSSDRSITALRFLDTTHGWAVQRTNGASRLLHTRDGKLWIAAGTINANLRDYMFTSESNGVSLSGSMIEVTRDGGRTWQQVFPCAAKIQVNGLWQNVGCQWQRLQFVTPTVAYAVARSLSPRPFLFFAKTTDGGASWAMVAQELTGDGEDGFFP